MDGRIDMIIDGGDCEFGLESTVIKLDGNDCVILRPGAVTADMLAEVCDKVVVSPAVDGAVPCITISSPNPPEGSTSLRSEG